MMKKTVSVLVFMLSLPALTVISFADFDEKFWEMYAEILVPPGGELPPLGGIYLDQWYFTGQGTRVSFSDIRILTSGKVEVPYQIVTRAPDAKAVDLPVRMLNLSVTDKNETYFEGALEKTPVLYNTLEIITEEKNFYRQVQVFGSQDARTWNTLRSDAVIFNYTREDTLKHTKITFPESHYQYLGIKLINNNDKPLNITGLKVSYQKSDPGIESTVPAGLQRYETDARSKESSLLVRMHSDYPFRKVQIHTNDTNFQRRVDILIKGEGGAWRKWAEEMLFRFETENVKESKLWVTFPEISTKEMKLVIRNYDSPPLKINGITVSGYRKALVFTMNRPEKYYVFWGNLNAKSPQYDISGLVVKQDLENIPIFPVGQQTRNANFIGHVQSLPFTERYKYFIYIVVALVMVGLMALQYLVLKKTGNR
ncbi:MAG: DUF3999 family protein [bacterium]